MRPVLFEVGGLQIYSHSFFLVLGLLAGLAVLLWEARRRGWSRGHTALIATAAFVGGALGARVSMILFVGPSALDALGHYAIFDPRLGPGSILGGIAGGYVGGYIASHLSGRTCTCDAFAPAMALGMAVGRLGDFFSGEDGIGKPTTLPVGVPAPGVDYLVHPAPLYDSAFNLLWFGALLVLRDRPAMQNGNLLKLGIGGYAVFRFFVEFVRNNDVVWLGLTAQQYVCLLALIALGAYALYRYRRGAARVVAV
ncbi:MAG TPA: prolipoprotein diacylglyceryl transferase family protein [Candidatus Limnocylindria bacterium]